jgi:hypothetical protein
MTMRCGGMLLNITMAAHPIAAAVAAIVTVGQWCRRISLKDMPRVIAYQWRDVRLRTPRTAAPPAVT